MTYCADRFFEKHTKEKGKSLAWIAHQLGYSATYVRKVSCHMRPVSDGFIGRAVTRLNEDPAIFLPVMTSEDAIIITDCKKN